MWRTLAWTTALWLMAVPARAAEPASGEGKGEGEVAHGPSAIDIGGYVSVSIGGTFLAGGAAAAIFALHKRIQLEAVCQPRDACPIATAQDIEDMQLAAHIATGLSVAGWVGMGIGAGLLLWPEGGAAESNASSPKVRVGPGSVELRLHF
jgi:hypothetical protein